MSSPQENKKYEDWQLRVIKERDELREKVNKLHTFMQSTKALELDWLNREYLTAQLYFMEGYLDILDKRIMKI